MASSLFQSQQTARNMTNGVDFTQMGKIMNMLKGGMSAKDLFYQQCKERNVDPNTILGMINKQ